MAHTTEAGTPCAAHAPRADDLLAPAALGSACFASLHDLASAMQSIGAAIDELDATITDPALRPLVEAAIEANEKATQMFVATRGVIRDPAKRKEKVALAALINRASHQAAAKPGIAGTLPTATVEVAVPIIAMTLAHLIDAATAAAGAPEVTAWFVDGAVAIAITAAAAAPAPASIGATLAIAARAVETHGGSVTCGEAEGRARYTVRLPAG
jgi:hypothetical protein